MHAIRGAAVDQARGGGLKSCMSSWYLFLFNLFFSLRKVEVKRMCGAVVPQWR